MKGPVLVRRLLTMCVSTIAVLPLWAAPASAKADTGIPVLNYHSIAVQPGNRNTIAPDKFKAQIDYLAQQGYHPLTMNEFTNILSHRLQPPSKPVLLTFDDGYADNYTYALPLLQAYHFPATLFLSPGMMGGYYLNWEQVRAMHKAGWDIEPHGMTHPHLRKLSKLEQTWQITESRRMIERELGVTADMFCYPYGQFNRTTLGILKENGFRYAFSTKQGFASARQNPYKLKRIFIDGEERFDKWKKKLE